MYQINAEKISKSTSSPKFNKECITIGAYSKLTLSDAKLVANQIIPIKLSHESNSVMERSHRFLGSHIEQRVPIYGLNTNFGDQVKLLDSHLNDPNVVSYYDSIQNRQENLIRSHDCGLGDMIEPEYVKVAIMLRAHCLAQGYSGVTPSLCSNMLKFLDAEIIPIVRQYGSIGASGDLIPLAMIASALTGQDTEVFYRNEVMPAIRAMELAGVNKIIPQGRDGLAMINGTSFMTAITSIVLYDLKRLYTQLLKVIAMALESMQVISSAYHPLVHQLKSHSGENAVNNFLCQFWQGSQLLCDLDELRHSTVIINSTTEDQPRGVQDYYSLRSVSQGFGPMLENLETSITRIEHEMNSINDNPIVDAIDQKIHHGANFMGFHVVDTCDILKGNIAQASTWIHALLAIMVHPRKNNGLPANLVENPHENNGFRPLQLLTAALAVQNRKLGQIHQAYTLPTEGDNQDVNSLGTHAAFDFKEAVSNLESLTAILLLAATQALELRGLNRASEKSQEICRIVRNHSEKVTVGRPMTKDINKIILLLKDETI